MLPRSLAPALCLLACGLSGIVAAGPKKKKDHEAQKVLMSHHSFQAPLEYKTLLDDWTVSGATLFERERLLLHPGVAGLHGFAFSNAPLLTSNFEVILHFRVVGDKQPENVLRDQAFGLWYVHENVSKVFNETIAIKASSWKSGLEEQEMTLVGSRANFEGFGVVLSMADREKKPKPMVSGFTNDGHTKLTWEHDVPTPDAKAIDFRNTLNAAQLKIRVQPNSIEAWLKQSPSLSWNECFVLDRSKHPMKAGGYLGITAWSGTPADGLSADLVSVVQIDVNNMDETSIGEEMKDVAQQIQETYMEMLTDEHRHFLDQKSQTDHLQRLVDTLADHINQTAPIEKKLFEDLQGFEQRMERLGEDCKNYRQAAHILLDGPDHKQTDSERKANVDAMKNEIVGLRRLLVKDGATHMHKIEAVQKNIAEVKERKSKAGTPQALSRMSQHTESLEKTVKSRGSQMSWMMICILGAIAAIGGLMWNRMRYYEKKYFQN